MFKISRRKAMASAGTALIGGQLGLPWIRKAQAAQFTYKFASDIPASHPVNVRMKEAAAQIEHDTDGRVRIDIYPNSELGGDPDMFSQLRAGAIDFFTLSGANALSTLVPKASISGVGYAFKDYTEVYQAMDGELGAHIRQLIQKSGIDVLDKIWDNGFRQITTSTKPIQNPADLKNMKIRVPPGKLWVSLFKSLGAAPTTISFNETYSALQTKVVDGEENALETIDAAKLYEVQKYCSLTNHMWDGFWFLMNRAAWNRLPASARDSITKNVNAAALKERHDVASLNKNLQGSLEGKGLKFNTTDPEQFRNVLKKSGFYGAWKQRFGAEEWALLEKVTGPLA